MNDLDDEPDGDRRGDTAQLARARTAGPGLILFLLGLFLLVMVNVLLKRRAGPKPESVRPPDKADLERSEAALTEWQIQSHNRPPWYELASRLSPPALQIGFVVLFWSSYVWR